MAGLNKMMIIGYLGNKPEVRSTNSGQEVTSFSVGVTDKKGSDETTWFEVSAWGQAGKFAAQYLGRGDMVLVEGRLKVRAYMGKDNRPRAASGIDAHSVQSLSSKGTIGADAQKSAEQRPSSTGDLWG